MTKRGLLIGSATGGLAGVAHDVKVMARWLDGLGFELDIRQHADATREGILEGLKRITRSSHDGDVAVVYYSGHGGYSQVRSRERLVGDRIMPRAVQYLVPTDHDKRTAFRGIFRTELSLAMRDLAEKTSNISVVLDCCHATDAVRDDDDALVKAVIEPWGEGTEAHVAWLLAQGHDLDRLPEVRNPSVVLLSACEATSRAFEITRGTDGVRCGLFTDCLLRAASTVSDPSQVTWNDLMRRVVDYALRYDIYQRPQVSGPSSRYVFAERRQRRTGALPFQGALGRWSLSAGEAAGIMLGDRYQVIDPLAGDAHAVLAEVAVSEVNAYTAALDIAPGEAKKLPPGLLALPRPGGPTHQRCRIEGDGPLADELRGRVLEIAGLDVVGNDYPGTLAFVLDVIGDQATVRESTGRRLRWPWRDVLAMDPSSRRERVDVFIEDLRRLVRGTELLRVARDLDTKVIPRRLRHALTWGVVGADGSARQLPLHGADLTAGERVFLCIENETSWPLRVSVFDVGVGRAVALLNPNEPEGMDLGAGELEFLGGPELRRLTGLEVRWPEGTPPDEPAEETLVVFTSSEVLPLTSWETSDWCDLAEGRDLRAEPGAGPEASYAVESITFRLHPPKKDQHP